MICFAVAVTFFVYFLFFSFRYLVSFCFLPLLQPSQLLLFHHLVQAVLQIQQLRRRQVTLSRPGRPGNINHNKQIRREKHYSTLHYSIKRYNGGSIQSNLPAATNEFNIFLNNYSYIISIFSRRSVFSSGTVKALMYDK